MKAKLIKTEVNYILEDDKGVVIATTSLNKEGLSLSLKNCQAIELDWDLNELAKIEYPICEVWNDEEALIRELAFKKGFQKALELMGDKKFSEDDVILIAEYIRVASQSTPSVRTKDLFDEYQSLQQTEWSVKVEMRRIIGSYTTVGSESKVKGSGNRIPHFKSVPKLDAEGCLILKRI